jgi:hypothetical protein
MIDSEQVPRGKGEKELLAELKVLKFSVSYLLEYCCIILL